MKCTKKFLFKDKQRELLPCACGAAAWAQCSRASDAATYVRESHITCGAGTGVDTAGSSSASAASYGTDGLEAAEARDTFPTLSQPIPDVKDQVRLLVAGSSPNLK